MIYVVILLAMGACLGIAAWESRAQLAFRRRWPSWTDEPCSSCAQTGRMMALGWQVPCLDCDGTGRLLRADVA